MYNQRQNAGRTPHHAANGLGNAKQVKDVKQPRDRNRNRPLGNAIGVAAGTVGKIGKAIGSSLRIPVTRGIRTRVKPVTPGAPAGIEHLPETRVPPSSGEVAITCIDYNPDRVHGFDVDDLESFLATDRPDWCAVRWINVDGLHPHVVNRFRETYNLHTLAAEDVLHVPQRPKVESYTNHLFLTMQMVTVHDGQLMTEQVGMFFLTNTLITFQERRGDVWQPIRDRIHKEGTRVRQHDTGYLLYSLIDAIVDHCFPILEYYGDLLEQFEDMAVNNPTPHLLQSLHTTKRELVLLRRLMWPTRELLDRLYRNEGDNLSPTAKTFIRDVYDHTIQLVDIVETYREMASGLTDLYISAVSNRMNEIMKVLTIMASIFIPITFLAGVYGMNFRYFPELNWQWSYAVFWAICITTVTSLLVYFYRKGWIGKG